ncbi:hypothetical protein AAY80_074 [Stenotrophomonas phage vB_SmaS-DLP_6]|nr:hypothetical protein AAY80_074 [Stenotrophomonas phage vB_SmaS-DLP_6]
MTSRVITEENVTRVRETVAPNITINWNPYDNSGQVTFFLQDMITENGVDKGLQPHRGLRGNSNTGTVAGTMIVSMEEIMSSTLTLPDGSTAPGYMLMVMIKSYFDAKFTERLNSQDEADLRASIPVQVIPPVTMG